MLYNDKKYQHKKWILHSLTHMRPIYKAYKYMHLNMQILSELKTEKLTIIEY